ncbi:MAG TPA: hypothetical protein V6C88_13670 [Chroococcidiopsis sp.]
MSGLAIAIIGLWALAIGAVLLTQRWFSGKRLRQRRGLSAAAPSPWQKAAPGQVNRAVRQQLMRLLNGDRNTAERLLQDARFRYPGKSENWYWEKVVYDLRRDRRA